MSYLDKILQPGERVLVTGRLHWVIFLPALLLLIAAIAVAIWTALSSLDPGSALERSMDASRLVRASLPATRARSNSPASETSGRK